MSKLKQTFYHLVTTAWNSRLPLPGSDRGDCVSIVCLHGVHTREMAAVCPPPSSSVSAESFESNIRAVARHHRIISLSDAVQMLSGNRPWEPRCAVLTFDDSLKCTVDVAFPILSRLGLTATVFVSTAAIESGAAYWWLRLDHAFHRARQTRAEVTLPGHGTRVVDRSNSSTLAHLKSALRRTPADVRDAAVASVEDQLGVRLDNLAVQYPHACTMSWHDVRQAIQRGFSIGSHTVTHPNLAILSPEQRRLELTESKREIEKQTGVPCRHFCYPYGGLTADVAAEVKTCGYEAATTTVGPGRNSPGADLFTLRRYAIPAAAAKLGYVMSGFPQVISKSRPSKSAAATAAGGHA